MKFDLSSLLSEKYKTVNELIKAFYMIKIKHEGDVYRLFITHLRVIDKMI
jgi:hemin uptake protein HemP